ncbi:hypothetical protein ASD24_24540 [Paenibacillus sp. Root52]|uniref:hypothetical protein n=1 Tax=Paenibacillus sp. Root52 TaxID=1736552 RepID=UPI0006F59DA4|nr:hypothetical protein [Paenibacillus sp. Root52]KQY90968.1 hypothetical protein ASD24_24540 [Paenibacillus sp. Root52]
MANTDLKTIIKAFEVVVEQNISELEKLQNNVKRMRYMGRNIFLILALCIVGAYLFTTVKLVPDKFFMFVGMLLFVSSIPITMYLVKRTNKFLVQIGQFWFCISTLNLFITMIVHSFSEKPSIYYLAILVMCALCFLLCYSIFILSKELPEKFLIQYLSNIRDLEISLITGVKIEGKLKTITKHNDFVIETERGEVLIKNNAISYIMFRDLAEASD